MPLDPICLLHLKPAWSALLALSCFVWGGLSLELLCSLLTVLRADKPDKPLASEALRPSRRQELHLLGPSCPLRGPELPTQARRAPRFAWPGWRWDPRRQPRLCRDRQVPLLWLGPQLRAPNGLRLASPPMPRWFCVHWRRAVPLSC